MILQCHLGEFWSLDTDVSILSIKNEKLLNSNNHGSKLKFFQTPLGYRRFQIGRVFAEYDLFKTR